MKKIVLFSLLFVLSNFVYGQNFKYEFRLESVVEPAEAKDAIVELRDLLGVRVVKFHDDTDKFEILTDHDFEVEEMLSKLEANGVTILGAITKINLG